MFRDPVDAPYAGNVLRIGLLDGAPIRRAGGESRGQRRTHRPREAPIMPGYAQGDVMQVRRDLSGLNVAISHIAWEPTGWVRRKRALVVSANLPVPY